MAKQTPLQKRMKRLALSVALFFFLIGLPTLYWFMNDKSFEKRSGFEAQFPSEFALKGIDISHHQGEMDWELIFDELRMDTIINFVYCKATESINHIDTKWAYNRKKLSELGIVHGAYHFFNGKKPPREQVKHFLSHWKFRDIDLPPMLDVETEGFSDQDLIAKMEIWLTEVEKETNHRPIIYCSLDYFEKKFKNHFAKYKFWIAAYSREPRALKDERVIYWQFSEKGKIPGCNERIDLNVGKPFL